MADRPNSANELKGNGEIASRLFKITVQIFSQGYNVFYDVQTCFIPSYQDKFYSKTSIICMILVSRNSGDISVYFVCCAAEGFCCYF